MSGTTQIPENASPPSGEQLFPDARDSLLPRLYEVKEHAQVLNKKHGRIFILYQDFSQQATARLFRKAANWAPPQNETERIKRGYPGVDPSRGDLVFVRNMQGDGREESDILKVWSICKEDFKPEERPDFNKLRTDLLGPSEQIGLHRPAKIDGVYEGGIEFERSDDAISIVEEGRAYFVSASVQSQVTLLAPSVGNKRLGDTSNDLHRPINRRLINVGAASSVLGMGKAPPHVKKALHYQSELTNLPHIGHDHNHCQPTYQLNVAAGTSAESAERLTASLGQFGGTHIDKLDSTTAPTAMTVLSEERTDIQPEYFYILELGIAIKMTPSCTIFFSGLHFHGGAQPKFKAGVVNPPPYYRLTLIMYPPSSALDTPGALAFAGLPPKRAVLNVSTEMRDPRLDPPTFRFLHAGTQRATERPCTQATFIYDGADLMTRRSYLNHLSRCINQIIAQLISQAPPEFMCQWDKDMLIQAFSLVDEKGSRIWADKWPLGPGWSYKPPASCDPTGGSTPVPTTRPSTAPPPEPTSDPPSNTTSAIPPPNTTPPVPYDNPERMAAIREWANHVDGSGKEFAVSALCDRREAGTNRIIGALPFRRQAAIERARQGDGNPETDIDMDGPLQNAEEEGQGRSTERRGKDKAPGTKGFSKPKGKKQSHKKDKKAEGTSAQKRKRQGAEDLGHPNPKRIKRNHKKGKEAVPEELVLGTESQALQKTSSLTEALQIERLRVLEGMLNREPIPPSASTPLTAALAHLSCPNDATPHLPDVTVIAQSVRSLWTNLNVGNTSRRIQEAVMYFLNMKLWEWLDWILDASPDWLSRLYADLGCLMFVTSKEHVIYARDYVPGMESDNAQFTLPVGGARSCFDLIDAAKLNDKLADILAVWLGFPDRADWQHCAWFSRQIITHIGVEGLILPPVILAASHLNTYVLGQGRNVKVTRPRIEQWAIENLSNHAITLPTTLERSCLERMFERIKLAHPDCAQLLLSGASPRNHQKEVAADLLTLFEIMEPLAANPDLPIHLGHPSSRGYRLRKLLKDVQKHSDKKLAFRDKAASRRRVLETPGPFSPVYLRTRAGFFSALVHRGITHHTQFLLENKTVFSSYEDFKRVASQHNEPPTYFCDKSAYGQPTSRSIDFAPDYWETDSHAVHLDSWLLTPDSQPVDFLSLYTTLLDASIEAFGTLTIYLLAVDYALAGLAHHPSPLDMGTILHTVNAGGLTGLRKLGFPCRTEDETGQAFELVFKELKEKISEERQETMAFNVFTVEHALCKLDRVGKTFEYKDAEEEWRKGIRL
ncbi:hypothetical protein BDN72DRAFT_902867 [Pluteus cervinus]|uniref:Uncharacterized protein n=1 Tax=Pluteus cervinus TaxID=181527 RepID=A0ACD3ADG7_9AGAR|nr:hypothetical protein BDN72DRAFT_902867 [Pluteus cervinus]